MDMPDNNVRTRLSLVWVFVMLNLVFADVLSFMNAGFLQQIMEGHAEQVTITPAFLLLAAVVTEIPIAMVVLCQILPQRANRWANMIAGVFTIAYVWGGGALTAPHYVFIASVETLGCLYIAWFAWRQRESGAPLPARGLALE